MVRWRDEVRTALVTTALVAAVTLGAACSGDDDDGGTDGDAAATPTTDALTVFLSIETCENDGGDGTATGTVDNEGESPAAYRIEIEFTDDESDDVLASGTDDTEIVAPGATAEWEVSAGSLGDAEPTCRTKSVTPVES